MNLTTCAKARAATFVIAQIAILLLAACSNSDPLPKIGIILADSADIYSATIRSSFETAAARKARLSVMDCRRDQAIAQRIAQDMMIDEAKATVVQPVFPAAIPGLVKTAAAGGKPIVIIGRDPDEEAILGVPSAYFIGVHSIEAVEKQVQIVAGAWKADQSWDRNGDGRLQYLLCSSADWTIEEGKERAKARDQAFIDAGLHAEREAEVSLGPSKAEAERGFDAKGASINPDSAEAIFCDSDEIALGVLLAWDASPRSGAKRPLIVGIGGIGDALDSIAKGDLLGTASCDPARQGRAAYSIASITASGSDPVAIGWALQKGRFVYIPYKIVTRENYRLFLD